jgi:MraZ protein
MLSGMYECTLDNRFRLAIPSKVREPFVEAGAAMSLWFDDSVVLAPRLEWPKIVERTFGEMNVMNDDQRQLSRLLHAYTFDQEVLDKQGRVVVPEKLRRLADVDTKVTVVGAGDYLEIWNPQRLEATFEALRREGVSTLGNRIVERAA